MNAPTHASATQVGGNHYKDFPIQPWDFIAANNIGWFEGSILEYVIRWQAKGGVESLRKAQHLITKMIELAVKTGWPHTPLTEDQVAELIDPNWRARVALRVAVSEPLREAIEDAIANTDSDWLANCRLAPGGAEVSRVPTTDDAAVERAVEATQQITEALATCAAIQQGITGKPFPLHTALRTTIKHTESSLLTALRDLQAFRDIVRENHAHE